MKYLAIRCDCMELILVRPWTDPELPNFEPNLLTEIRCPHCGKTHLYTIGNADSQLEAKICFYIAGGWALIYGLWVMGSSVLKSHGMKTITAIIRPDSLDTLAEALNKEELVKGMTITEVKGFGRTLGSKTDDKPTKVNFLEKLRVDVVVNAWDVPHIIDIMQDELNTGNKGDGKIFVSTTDETIRVRTGETGVEAV